MCLLQNISNYASCWICTAAGSFPLAIMGHEGFGWAFLLAVFVDSGCSLRDFVTDVIQINFLCNYMLRITDALGDLGGI